MNEDVKATGVEETVPPTVDVTKIVAERLKTEKQKLQQELAKAHGYESYDELLNSGINKKLLDSGIDPDTVKPVFDELLSKHPAVIKANEVLSEYEKRTKDSALSALNEKFGTTFETLDDIPAETKSLLEKGVTLEQAYIATNFDKLQAKAPDADQIAKAQGIQSKAHMKTVPGSGAVSNELVITQDVIAAIQKQMPNATMDQIKAFYAKHPHLLK